MDLGLRDRVAVVTGASRGIGRAIALGLAEEGCHVGLCARGEEALRRTAAEIEGKGVRARPVVADMARFEDIERLVEETRGALGRIDILINNVGGGRGAGLEGTSEEDWELSWRLNILAALRACRLVVPEMKERRWGRIISISSIYGREWGGTIAYNTVKVGLIGFSKNLARELAPFNVLVNTVAPGSVLHPGGSWERRLKADPERIAAFIESDLPFGRFGRPEEIANVVVFLASERASLVSGACINVDGCQSRSLI